MNGNRIVYITWFIIMSLMLYIEFKPEEKKQVDSFIAVYRSGQGKVYYREPYQTTWDSMSVGDRLSPGSHVATGPKSGATIVLNDGHEIKLEENSQINLAMANDTNRDNYLVDVIQGNMQVAKAEIKSQPPQNVIKTVFKNITEKPADFRSVKSFFTNIVKPEEKGINVTTKDVAVNIPENVKALNIDATGAKTKFTTQDGKTFVPPVKVSEVNNSTTKLSTNTETNNPETNNTPTSNQKQKDPLTLAETPISGDSQIKTASSQETELELALESKFPDEFSPEQNSKENQETASEATPDATSEIASEAAPNGSSDTPVPLPEEDTSIIKLSDIPKFQKNEKIGFDGVIIWEENFLAIEPLLNIKIKASKNIPKDQTYILKVWSGNDEGQFEKLKTQVKTKNELTFVIPKAKFINWLTNSPTPVEIKWGLYLTNQKSEVANKELFRDSIQFFSVPHLKGNYFEVRIDSTKKAPSTDYTYFRNNIVNPTSSYDIGDKALLRQFAEGRNKDQIVEIKVKEAPVKKAKNGIQTLFVSKGKVIFSSEDTLTKDKINEMLKQLGADFAFKGRDSDILSPQQILQGSMGNSNRLRANYLTLPAHYPINVNYKALANLIYGPKALSQTDNIFIKERPEIFTSVPYSTPDAKLKSILTAGSDTAESAEKMIAFLNIDKNSGLSWKKKSDIKLTSLRGFRDANPQMINANFVVNGISLSSFFKKEKDDKKVFDFIEKIAKCDLLIVAKELSDKDVQVSLFYKESANQTFHLQMDLLERAAIPRWVYESLGYDATAGEKVVDSYVYLSNYPKKILKSNQGFIWPNSSKSVFFNPDSQLATPYLFQCEIPDDRGCIAKILSNNKLKIQDLTDAKVTLLGRRTLQDSQKPAQAISH